LSMSLPSVLAEYFLCYFYDNNKVF